VLLYGLMVICALSHSINPLDLWSTQHLATESASAAAAAAAEASGGGGRSVAGAVAEVLAAEATVDSGISGAAGIEPPSSFDFLNPAAFAQFAFYYLSSAGGLYTWWHFLWVEVGELRVESGWNLGKHYSSFW
jgi:hypothetical protein